MFFWGEGDNQKIFCEGKKNVIKNIMIKDRSVNRQTDMNKLKIDRQIDQQAQIDGQTQRYRDIQTDT